MSLASPRAGSVLLSTAVLALAVFAASAPADDVVHVPALSGAKAKREQKLRARETTTLGAAHAAHHARQRRLARDPRARARVRRAARRAREANRRARASALPAQDGAWGAPFDIKTVGIHAALLPTGKVMWFSRPTSAKAMMFQATLWDPATGTSKDVTPPLNAQGKKTNIFCAGQSFLADGRLLVAGGNLADADKNEGTEFKGLNTVFSFNPFNETWTRQPDMREGRWYPTQVLLPDGRTVIMDGYDSGGVVGAPSNNDIEVFTPSPDLDGVGTVTRLPQVRGGAGAPPEGGLYPHMRLLPSGRTLVAGPARVDSWLMRLGAGMEFAWEDVKNPGSKHYFGTGVIMPRETPGSSTVALIGGNHDTRVEAFDETQAAAGWFDQSPLQVGRDHLNTVLLPDGSMVSVGGGDSSMGTNASFRPEHLAVELYDPGEKEWRTGAAQAEGRAYHSTALLLPDGRVISAGDDTNGGVEADTAEIYSPPYLFEGGRRLGPGERPQVGAMPSSVDYGQAFGVGYSGTDVARAVLIAPGAVTHANDMNQRYVPLVETGRTTGTLSLSAPANPNLAPPGWYMLFLVDAQGVPSEAKWVRVGAGVAAPPPGNGGGGAVPGGDGGATPPADQPPAPAQPAAPPAAPAAPLPAPPAPPVAQDLLRRVTVKRTTVSDVVRRGLRVGVGCTRGCTIRGQLLASRRVARRAGLAGRRGGTGDTTVGRGSLALARAGDGRLVVTLTPAARRRLPRTRAITLTLRLTAKAPDAAQRVVRRVKLEALLLD